MSKSGQLIHLEEEFEESEIEESLCEEENEAIEIGGCKSPRFKSKKCQFKCEKEYAIRKHVNTKDSYKEINDETIKSNNMQDNRSQSEKSHKNEIEYIGEDDLFLLECEALMKVFLSSLTYSLDNGRLLPDVLSSQGRASQLIFSISDCITTSLKYISSSVGFRVTLEWLDPKAASSMRITSSLNA